MARTMGYCKWRNSLSDLLDIKQRLDETHSVDDIQTEAERAAYTRVLELIHEIAETYT